MVPLNFDPAIWKALFLILGLIGFDVFLGIVLAIKSKTFDVRKLPGFLQTDILPIVLPLFGLAVMAMWYPDMRVAFLAATAAATTMYGAFIKDKIEQLTGLKLEINLLNGGGVKFYRLAARVAMSMRLPKVGDWVFYRLASGCLRPALVVNVFNSGFGPRVNMVVFLDGSNDKPFLGPLMPGIPGDDLTAWATSVAQGDGPGQWQFPPE